MSAFSGGASPFLKVVPKQLFFDRALVRRTVSADALRGMSRIGAFVRRRSRSSMRRSRARIWIKTPGGYIQVFKPSKPGSPPLAHRGDLKNIFFALDPRTLSVVIGPLAYNRRDVPALLEFGGSVTREATVYEGRGRDAQGRFSAGKPRRARWNATIRPRPYMRPALAAEVAAGTIPRTMFARAGAA